MGHISRMQHERNQIVVRSNEIIQNSRYSLSACEEDIITFMASLIKYADDKFEIVEFTIPDFCRACGLNPTSGKNYERVKSAITKLKSRVIWIDFIDEDGNDAEQTISWLDKAIMVKGTGIVKLKFDNDLGPHFLKLEKNFTMHETIYFLHLRNEYDKRLYLYCKSRQFNKLKTFEFDVPLQSLKKRLGAGELTSNGEFQDTTFTTWQKFKERCLDPAIKRVNAGTDIHISYIPIKESRSVVGLKLTITTKDAIERLQIVDALKNGSSKEESDSVL